MVKKANGKWRMCTDYNDLNKACPKDPYSLPNIDRLVDEVPGFSLLSFIDTYSRYNQIKMHPRNEAKITFITDAKTFYYKAMPFGLKNVGATYQCPMDKIFEKIIGTDVEVYMDDMMVKSMMAGEHCNTLKRVFQLKLNPEKCSFRVQAGKFLGFMLTERGIEAYLEKCQVIINMRSPQMVKEVQQLSVETAIPIFNTLKKGERFTWIAESEETFLRLKAMLATPPTLTKLTPRYTSSDTKKRYQRIEKAALALVITSRRLRSYFQGHSIVVRTDLPIKQVLRKSDLLGRMVAWRIQLSEFGISYENRGYIKA
ncbi:Retrovirus-related Pol polyprotein from transposon 17.6, partial [Mucuna pruriens]